MSMHYYGSRQTSSRRPQLPSKDKLKPLPWIIAGAVLLIIILFWLLLGPFRFLLWKFPAFTGFPFTSRNYLVLIQDNEQLMPTGGTIQALGEWRFSHGVNKGITLNELDIYDDGEDRTAPLLVMSVMLEDEPYSIAHANYDPDLGVTKQAVAELYSLTEPDARIDGIITLDNEALEMILSEEAPGDLEELERQLNRELRYSIFMPWRLPGLTQTLAEAFNAKHAQAHFNKNGIAKAFAKRNWDGGLLSSSVGDFLSINEANFSSLPTDPVIIRDVQYELDVLDETDILGNPVVEATLTVRVSHEGSSGTHQAYLRSLIPLASDISSPFEVSEEREDVQVLGEMLYLEPGDSIAYTYRYELPEFVWVEDSYLLNLEKQAGTIGDHLRVIVRVPEGMSLDSTKFKVHENVGIYETQLTEDQQLSFQLVQDAQAPELLHSSISAWNQITLEFNEPLNANAEDPSRYRITGLTVLDASLQDNKVILTTEGMVQAEEPIVRQLSIRDIQDTRGNLLTPNPMEIELIQSPELAPEAEDGNNEAEIDPEPEPEPEPVVEDNPEETSE